MPNQQVQSITSKLLAHSAILIFTSCLFYFKLGFEILNPMHYMWLLPTGSDSASDFMAWLFYKNDVWRFPIGVFEGYSYPEKVGVGLTGAIPLLAIPLKLFKSFLPQVFQYYGIWLFLCYYLQAVIGYKILDRLNIKSIAYKTIGACFIGLSYSLIDRLGHMNLCAHWIILLSIYIYFGQHKLRSLTLHHLGAITISILVHPYLVVFTTLIFFADITRLFLSSKKKVHQIIPISAAVVLQTAAIGIIWYVLGNTVIDSEEATSTGFGSFSANLNCFISPKTDSAFFNGLIHHTTGQYEGIAYLGIGGLILILIALISYFSKTERIRKLSQFIPIIILSLGLFMFSLSNIVTFNELLVIDIPIYEWLEDKFNILRASGRYVWLLQYLIVIFSLVLVSKLNIKQLYINILVGILLLLNIIDFSHALKRATYYTENTRINKISDPLIWEEIYSEVDNVLMLPSYGYHYVHQYDAIFFAFLAAQSDKSVNTGHLARFSKKDRTTFQNQLVHDIENNKVNPKTTFITNQQNLGILLPLIDSDNYSLYEIDAYLVLIPNQYKAINATLQSRSIQEDFIMEKESFPEFIVRNKKNYVLITVKDDANNHLVHCMDQELLDGNLYDLQFREPYIAILHNEKLLVELLANKKTKLEHQEVLLDKKVDMISIGSDNGLSSIKIDQVEYSKNQRGLNIVVLDPKANFIESAHFDTYRQCFHFSNRIGKTHIIHVVD